MNSIDLVLAIFLLITVLFGLKKGFIAAVIQFAALAASFILIAKFGPFLSFFLCTQFNLSEFAATIISYFLTFLLIAILAVIIIKILHKTIKLLKLTFINRILGAFLGLINGILILIVILMLIKLSPFENNFINWAKDSKIISSLYLITNEISENIPNLKEKNIDGIDELFDKHEL